MRTLKQGQKPYFDTWTACAAYVEDVGSALLDEHVVLILELIRARDHAQLSKVHEVIGFEYLQAYPNGVLKQVAAFFKKNLAFEDRSAARATALRKFFACEEQCRETNRRLYDLQLAEWQGSLDIDLNRKIKMIRRTIRSVLGSLESFESRLLDLIKVTSGASSTRRRRFAQPVRKMGRRVNFTSLALPHAHRICELMGISPEDARFCVNDANRLAFVPKTWSEYRTIAAESEGNLAFQLAFDRYLKGRLKWYGVDLTDQTRNQELALEGSLTGKLATVDLSSASDTLALDLIVYLFPEDWAKWLLAMRSPYYKLEDGLLRKYHKLSSMGNGATFTVESLVFFAVAKATGSNTVSVFGDDIIIDTDCYEGLVSLLSLFGFTVNLSKSFAAGPFRESCGRDYWRGTDIRPFFVRKAGYIQKNDLSHLVNGLSRLTYEGKLWRYLRNLVTSGKLPVVPLNETSTSGVFVDHVLWPKRLLHTNGWVVRFKGLVLRERNVRKRNAKAYLLWVLTRQTTDDLETSVLGSHESYGAHGWILWRYPGDPESAHLHRWTYFLLRK